MYGKIVRAGALLLLLASPAWGQSGGGGQSGSPLPDISFIADTRLLMGDAAPRDLELQFSELEVAATGYLNPFARGDVYFAFGEHGAEVEEAFLTLTALPGGWSLKGGIYYMDVGRFIPLHPHAFPFVNYPLFVTEYFTEEGYHDIGFQPSTLLEVGPAAVTVRVDAVNGQIHEEEGHEEEGSEPDTTGTALPPRTLGDFGYNGTVNAFFTTGDFSWLDVGTSVGTAFLGPPPEGRTIWYDLNAKFKWVPNRRTAFTAEAEIMFQDRDVETLTGTGTTHPMGFFVYADYVFGRHWNVGPFVDYAQDPHQTDLSQTGVGGFLGYSVFEETTVFRLMVRHDSYPDGESGMSGILQVLFGLGPHRPHQF